ncbi:hypothetical protein [Caballeronia sp. TF1N1]|uniref:hypothetical protein n=1 Tax=Caballeronia sp. TF1N1 TaxID=2878153 RepID=UPI001FD04BBE|nr:hypothetical protein [Caballeronia sp. TF1N1]
MLTLTQVAAAIVSGATAVESAIVAVGVVVRDVKTIVAYIPDLMQTFENAYAQIGQPTNGAGKLAGVLAALEAVAARIGVVWTDSIKALVSDIIAQAKAAYNAVVSAAKGPSTALPSVQAAV